MPEPTQVHQIPPPPLHLGPQLASARAAKVAPVVAQLESPPTPDVLQRPKRAKVPQVMLSAERDAASCGLLALISDGGKLPLCIICAEDDLSKQTINEPTPNNLQGYFEGPYFQPANEGADVISFRKAVVQYIGVTATIVAIMLSDTESICVLRTKPASEYFCLSRHVPKCRRLDVRKRLVDVGDGVTGRVDGPRALKRMADDMMERDDELVGLAVDGLTLRKQKGSTGIFHVGTRRVIHAMYLQELVVDLARWPKTHRPL
jgi:hypothetical protein